MEKKVIEKRHYQSKKKSDIINVPQKFRREFLSVENNVEILDAPISAIRILWKVFNDVSHDQFREENPNQRKQLSLFSDEFKTENNTYARFTFKLSDIAPNKDYSNVKNGLVFLTKLKEGWYQSKNEKGKIIKSYGGFISEANISDGNISFLVSSYWMEKIVLLGVYNSPFIEMAWVFTKAKQVLFYLWLLELKEEGTTVNFAKFQAVYGYNYKDANTYAKNVLKVMKTTLDKNSNVSFNYSVKGNNINIIRYYTLKTELIITEKTSKNQEVNQKLHYWKTRHKVESENIDVLKSLINIDYGSFLLFKKAYSNLIKSYRLEKKSVTELQGSDFIKIFQEEIITTYRNSAWGNISKHGYPIIKQG